MSLDRHVMTRDTRQLRKAGYVQSYSPPLLLTVQIAQHVSTRNPSIEFKRPEDRAYADGRDL
jgi:hypothetical protein